MRLWRRFGLSVAAPMLLWSGIAFAQTETGSPPAQQAPRQQGQTPQMVEGQVIKIDHRLGRVTIRTADGTVHEFQASKETLQDLKEGDRIEARLRP